jgi:hypothetical protein
MPIDSVRVTKTDRDDLEITLRGTPAAIVDVLAEGMPREALEQLADAIQHELDRRDGRTTHE